MKTVRIPKGPVPGPAERGETTLALSALGKLTARVATEVAPVSGDPAGRLRRLSGRGGGAPAGVEVDVDGTEATVWLSVAFPYPESVREMSDRLRARVIEGVADLTDLRVVTVNITVEELRADDTDRPISSRPA